MKLSSTRNKLLKDNKLFKSAVTVVFWLGIWQLVYWAVNQDYLVASPIDTFGRLLTLSLTSGFWTTVVLTIARILLGFLAGVVVGTVLAVLTKLSDFIFILFSPIIKIIRATPVTSFIILALVWLSSANVPVFTAFLMVLPIVWANMAAGLDNIDKKKLEMAKIYSFTRMQKLKLIYIPALLPFFSAALTTGLGLAWKAGIAAEVIGRPKNAVGTAINDAKLYLETVDLFAWTAVVIIVSIFAEAVFVRLFNRFIKKYTRGKA